MFPVTAIVKFICSIVLFLDCRNIDILPKSAEMSDDAKSRGTNLEKGLSIASKIPRELPASFLKEITNNFSQDRLLGSSVFGSVYKVLLRFGSNE